MEKNFTTNNIAHTTSILIGAITIATGGMIAVSSRNYTTNSGRNSINFGSSFVSDKSNPSKKYDHSLSFNSSKTDSEVITMNEVDWGKMQQNIENLSKSVQEIKTDLEKLPTKDWVTNQINDNIIKNYKQTITNLKWFVGISVTLVGIFVTLVGIVVPVLVKIFLK